MFVKVLSVTQITEYIKRLLSADAILNNVYIRGEISNFKHHYSGHMYFTLKDEGSKIKCVMFKNSNMGLKFYPEDGMNVIVSGSVSLYERDGQYQLYVNSMEPDGKGALYVAYEQLKKRLQEEGLFSAENKLPIPKYPCKIGVVTSSTGAAVRDIINVTTRRFPGINILVVPVMVQGEGAAGEISSAIEYLNTRDDIDVIITGRGGGSIEELWAFNEECVARAIYNSRIPVISAVGHETDFTIADFVSDLRAPTPSAAAELCVPDKKEIKFKLNTCSNALYSVLKSELEKRASLINQNKNLIFSLNPLFQINQRRQYLDSMSFKLASSIRYKLDMKRQSIKKCSTNLESLSPLSIISRGYSISYKSGTKNIVDDVRKVKSGDNVDIYVKNGTINCVVKNIEEEEIDHETGKRFKHKI